ncbi:hypothetical protein HA402_004122 [Bradysia odoriphaga]|nr:hypothetical protein HA402_004122 [Bradysia odoriphaga]
MPLPPLVEPVAALSAGEAARTARHAVLYPFGEEGQRRLAAAHVAIVGAGGLGSPAVMALAAAGVGRLTIIDDDVVELTNLQRQLLHRLSDIGAPKVDSAVRVAADLAPECVVIPVRERITAENAERMLRGAHVVLDGSDTFDTRTAVAAACESLGVPLVWGAVQEFAAQVTVFWSAPPAGAPAVRLSDLHPADSVGDVPSCAEVGVLGSVVLQAGSLMATQAILLIAGIGEPLLGRVALIDALRSTSREIPLRAADAGRGADAGQADAAQPPPAADLVYVDVRDPAEQRHGVIPGAVLLPLDDLLADDSIRFDGTVVTVCASGIRSRRAADVLRARGVDATPGGTRVITVDEYVARVLAETRAHEHKTLERVAVTDAVGRTLVADAVARLEIPAFDNSAMDGFAVRFADVATASDAPVALRVTADVAAGSAEDPPVAPGTAARIMTGAAVPTDADTIVPFEATAGGLRDSLDTALVVASPAAPGAHVRRRGEDVRVGEVVLASGTLLGPLQIAALVAAGVTHVDLSRRPRVLVISTGAELVAPGVDPGPGQIPDSNSTLLALLAARAGCEVVDRVSVDDDPASLTALLAAASDVDVVITSGGVSAGAFEPVRLALDGVVAFEKVAMQPGKPQAFGRLPSGALFFGLPGNPVSVAVSFEVIVRPALHILMRREPVHRPLLRLPVATGWRTPPERAQYIPVTVRDGQKQPTVRSATARGFVRCAAATVALLRDGAVPKGDVLAVARIAGIQGAKQTAQLLPLAHIIGVHGATVDLQIVDEGVEIEATVRTADRTGVEMEAVTAVTIAALTVLDMRHLDARRRMNAGVARPGTVLVGVVLAGGRASRVDGADKAMFEIDGMPLIRHAVDALSECARVVIVGSDTGRPHFDDVTWVREDPPFGGPVAGIARALEEIAGAEIAGADAAASEILLLPADLPGAAEAAALLTAAELGDDDGVVLVDDAGIPQWLTARYRAAPLRAAIAGSDATAVRSVVSTLRLRMLPAPANATRDVDTWDDLQQAKGSS